MRRKNLEGVKDLQENQTGRSIKILIFIRNRKVQRTQFPAKLTQINLKEFSVLKLFQIISARIQFSIELQVILRFPISMPP